MKRLVVLSATLLALTAAPFALASGGLGKFKTTLRGTGGNTQHGQLNGTWTIDLRSARSGPLNLTWKGHPKGGGTYVISGSTITLTPKKGGSCKTKGKYHFKVKHDKLTFTPINDSCAVRKDVLTYSAWTKTS